MKHFKLAFPFAFILFIIACNPEKPIEKNSKTIEQAMPSKIVETINFSVVNKYPHDVNSFTEGFLFHDNKLFESTGSPENIPQTKSLFGSVDLATGKIDVKAELDKRFYFGEGIVFINDKVCQLTYTNQTGFVYDAKTFKKMNQFTYANKEGWGMTTDGKSIIMSDGTNELTYLNPNDFSVIKKMAVTQNNYALDYLNELEYINGFIYANVWMTHYIVKIDPATGEVLGQMDLTDLFNQARQINPYSAETNGIAYDSVSDKILVTGKMWPTIYQIDFKH